MKKTHFITLNGPMIVNRASDGKLTLQPDDVQLD